MALQDKALTSLTGHLDAIRRLLAEVQQLLAQLDERRRRERGEDGFDGSRHSPGGGRTGGTLMADDAHDDHVHQHDQLHAALAALLVAVPWTPLPLADDAGQDPTEPYATHQGVLELPGLGRVPCYRLNTGEPVFDLEVLEELLGREATGEHGREA